MKNRTNRDSLSHRAGDALERLGEKISSVGSKRIGKKIYDVGNKLEHMNDKKKSRA